MLYIVATPIGNLQDFSPRAVEILKTVDFIACEDTRHSRILLNHYQIKAPQLIAFHAHSSSSALLNIVQRLQAGATGALISDAGTPGISDPGSLLISAALAVGVKVCPIPGAAAFLTALMAAGFPTDKFVYYGFVPAKKGRTKLWQEVAAEKRTVVFYESPHRLIKTLDEMRQYFPDRPIVVARELTKVFEEFWRGTVAEAHQEFSQRGVKGEIVLVLRAL